MSETKTVWHPFPDEQPPREKCRYLVTTEEYPDWRNPSHLLVGTEKWLLGTWNTPSRVIAWAELPEPYKEKT